MPPTRHRDCCAARAQIDSSEVVAHFPRAVAEAVGRIREVLPVVRIESVTEYHMNDFLARFGSCAVVTGASSGITIPPAPP